MSTSLKNFLNFTLKMNTGISQDDTVKFDNVITSWYYNLCNYERVINYKSNNQKFNMSVAIPILSINL